MVHQQLRSSCMFGRLSIIEPTSIFAHSAFIASGIAAQATGTAAKATCSLNSKRWEYVSEKVWLVIFGDGFLYVYVSSRKNGIVIQTGFNSPHRWRGIVICPLNSYWSSASLHQFPKAIWHSFDVRFTTRCTVYCACLRRTVHGNRRQPLSVGDGLGALERPGLGCNPPKKIHR